MGDETVCDWVGNDPLMRAYHDKEWGNPVHDDRKLFEFLLLEFFQAGLSWSTILHKRENFSKAFDKFDYRKISLYDPAKAEELRNDAGIIRNRLKIAAAINNARLFIDIQTEFGSFDKYLWAFSGGKTICNRPEEMKDIPVTTKESDAMSKDLKKRGFKFTGSTMCYAYMQAIGMVNDHLVTCIYSNRIDCLM
ncbi:MAG: DNA-3-methyladenine glycosylase I [Candidatus Kapabacteria bacterium]|jgi:DNA-3-methyladenine glycosylase I|nr:DNA-3-methyladenine glycosylase I [Candidatus Kapabacteria bacterium]